MGGDHKCPLCNATFTRPQHVGRHLRAHTGDRPYECKECPLKFARSDLLSRHVNKAHPESVGGSGGGGHNTKSDKKQRRKSFPATASVSKNSDLPVESKPFQHGSSMHSKASETTRSDVGTVDVTAAVPAPSPYQGKIMYQTHPLLSQNQQQSNSWQSTSLNNLGTAAGVGISPASVNGLPHYNPTLAQSLGQPGNNFGYGNSGYLPPYSSVPMRFSGSDQSGIGLGGFVGLNGLNQSVYGINTSSTLHSLGNELGIKRRACDQCNHSKVRCDFAEPCARCANRSMQCTYTKPQRARTLAAYAGPTINPAMSLGSTTSQSPQFSSPATQSPSQTYGLTGHSRRNSIAFPASSNYTGGGTLLTSDALFTAQPHTVASRPPVPRTQWQPTNQVQQQQQQQSGQQGLQLSLGGMSGQNISGTMFTSPQTSTSTHNSHLLNQNSSPTAQGLAPTPSLTSSTSPATSDGLTERRGSHNSAQLINWTLPTGTTSFTDGTINLMNTFTGSSVVEQSPLSAVQTMQWPTAASSTDTALGYNSAILSEDDETPPSTMTSSITEAEKVIAMQQRRRSSAGMWATAFNQMRLDDTAIPSTLGNMNPAMANQIVNQLQQQQLQHQQQQQYQHQQQQQQQRQTTYSESDVQAPATVSDSNQAPSTDMLWGQFINPGAAATPDRYDVDPLTGRALGKSSSAPDLTTPPQHSAMFSAYLNGTTPKAHSRGQSIVAAASQTGKDRPGHESGTDSPTRKWKDQISQRHASFSMHLNTGVTGSSGISSTSPAQLEALQQQQRQQQSQRPPLGIYSHSTALQQTLAPERTPSFGAHAFVDTPGTSTGLNTSGMQSGALRTPTKLSSAYLTPEVRPGNKRQASQTLVPDTQKRAVFSVWDEDPIGGAGVGSDIDDIQKQNGMFSAMDSYPINLSGLVTSPTPPPSQSQHGHQMQQQHSTAGQTQNILYSTWPPSSAMPPMTSLEDLSTN